MRNLTLGLTLVVSVLWAGAVWAGPQTWQTANLDSRTKVSDLNGTPTGTELAKKAKKKLSDNPISDGTIEPGKTKMLDINGADEATELAKKKKPTKKYSESA